MKKLALVLMAVLASSAHAQNLKGIIVLAADGTFLGVCDNNYNRLSIVNEYGYGSEYRAESINNKYGRYGSEYSNLSPYNNYTLNVPYLFGASSELLKLVTSPSYKPSAGFVDSIKSYRIGRLTVNKSVTGAIHPEVFKAVCADE